jgi:hypothetical protein
MNSGARALIASTPAMLAINVLLQKIRPALILVLINQYKFERTWRSADASESK